MHTVEQNKAQVLVDALSYIQKFHGDIVVIKYGVNISSITKEIQEKIAVAVKQMTDVDVQHINIEVDNIEFD